MFAINNKSNIFKTILHKFARNFKTKKITHTADDEKAKHVSQFLED